MTRTKIELLTNKYPLDFLFAEHKDCISYLPFPSGHMTHRKRQYADREGGVQKKCSWLAFKKLTLVNAYTDSNASTQIVNSHL